MACYACVVESCRLHIYELTVIGVLLRGIQFLKKKLTTNVAKFDFHLFNTVACLATVSEISLRQKKKTDKRYRPTTNMQGMKIRKNELGNQPLPSSGSVLARVITDSRQNECLLKNTGAEKIRSKQNC